MSKNSHIGVSLWLMPPPNSLLGDALTSTINGLKPLFHDAPGFAPHITITSNIAVSRQNTQRHVASILDRACAAAASVDHLDVIVTGIVFNGTQFFKKVYFQVQQRSELLSLALISREEFVYLPELQQKARQEQTWAESNRPANSQAPAAPAPVSPEQNEALVQEAAQRASTWVRNDYDPHVSLVYSSIYPIDEAVQQTIDTRLRDVFGDNYAEKGIGWTGGRLALVECEGPVEQWKVLGYRDI
ncbi:hypothetical protein DV451_003065 [Geotrichum candidum]|uniref:2',3'-cyclic-nucleotide 3'-phosphodiesterase n=1 Tax=Geotrichum candidum TaxID=1173061 RepID=A0A9P5KTY1_GEOCN|nr:hypothetical protein DV451_003065 [Geotrichum candidum]KAF5110829.1 hypothetical protein DV453_000530 [Geotrichum candidum]